MKNYYLARPKKRSSLKTWSLVSRACGMVISLVLFGGLVSCGVKGDPIPPGRPPELGRGKPNYRRATEPLAFPVVPPPSDTEEIDEEKEEESD